MALVLADRVKDTTTTTGTGTITLSGTAPTGYVSFGTAIGNANTTYYTITAGSEWEVGVGTYTAAGTLLARTTVLASSNAGSLVNFSAGTKDVFVTYPAGKAISDGFGTLPATNGGTGLTSPGTSANVLTSNGTAWVSGTATAAYPQNVQSGNYTLVLGDAGKHIYSANTGAQTITIPTNASVAFPIGTLVTIVDMGTTKIVLSASSVSIIPNGTTTALSTPSIASGASVQLLKTATNSWNATFGIVQESEYTATYLVIAGGASGGSYNGGGGGAGGYLTSTESLDVGSTYTVTVGAGGAARTTTAAGNDGSNSVLSGTGVSITSTGGGGGGGQGDATKAGRTGGSGGGAAPINGTAGTGTSGQGNSGGLTVTNEYVGGGGGGAGAAGGNATGSYPYNGGAGGNGLASSITGTSVTRAGGGGGGTGSGNGGAGGSGGGGKGAKDTPAGAGTANTGSAGGGADNDTGLSGAGGSGVVILSIPTANYTGTTTGSPTVTTSGSNTILTFNSSGSYTA